MEESEFNQVLVAYNKKLDENLNINISAINEIKLKETKQKIQSIFIYRIMEIVCFSLLALFLGNYIAINWGKTHLAISGTIVHVFALVALVGSIGQLVLLKQINFSKPIVEIRKKIELVNSHGLFFIKLIFLSTPVWWSYAIISIDLFLGVDLYIYLDPDFVVRYLVVNFLLFIPLVWFLNKLSYKNLRIKWIRKTIRLFTGKKTRTALNFLNDIEKFEN